MERPDLCFGLLVAAFLLAAAAAAGSCLRGQTPVGSLCPVVLCPANKTCRVVKSSTGRGCAAQASCLKCVPQGVDQVCNSNHYYYVVLTGVPGVIGQLTDLKCNMNGPEDPACPEGSVCLPDNNGSGTCCYGKGYPPPGVNYVRNNDTVCPDECGGCRPGYVCKKVVNPCLIPPCPEEYRCVEKERTCPVLPAYIPDRCSEQQEKSKCDTDKDCPRKLLCCSDQCTVRRCIRGFN